MIIALTLAEQTQVYLIFFGYYFPLMVALACVSAASFVLQKWVPS